MLVLYVEAPFAVCRTFTAGWYRPTATFLTPSAAYGLLLNLAGIETRLREEDPGYPLKVGVPATVTRSGLPSARIALGASAVKFRRGRAIPLSDGEEAFPRVQTVYQQLHNYPVGASGGDRAETTFGSKYNISPVRRELLVALRAVIVLEASSELEAQVRRGVEGSSPAGRYGLPFLGDNAFLPDRLELLETAPTAHWYERVTADGETVRPRATRLTVWIDRADTSRTRSDLYAPTSPPSTDIPSRAWTEITPT
jgi:CRISPR-associated protein Cas5t